MVEQAVEQGRGQRAVIVEDFGPLLEAERVNDFETPAFLI
jgi:hypothetical protein